MSYRRRTPPPERRRFNGCLVWLVVAVWLVLGALLVYQYWFRQQVSQQIGRQISERLANSAPTPIPGAPDTGQTPGDGAPAASGTAGMMPTLVAALPSGEVRITDAQANAYILANADQLQPIESATLHFVPGEIQVDLVALGTTSTARMGAAIQAGQIIAIDPRVDGPLSNLVDLRDLIAPLQEQLNAELAAQNRRVTDVRIAQGELIFVVE